MFGFFKNVNSTLAVAAVLGSIAVSEAHALNVRWEAWGKGREVAAGKMVKWAVNKSGQVYLNYARAGAGWQECRRPQNFFATQVAAHGQYAAVASDDARVVLYERNPGNGACILSRELTRSPVLVRDLGYDGRILALLGEDGDVYMYANGWRKQTDLKGASPGAAFNTATARGKNPNAVGKILCDLPSGSSTYLLVDAKHGKSLIGGNRERPAHDRVDHNAKPYADDAIWALEGVPGLCLFRIRDTTNPDRYLVSGDSHDNRLYLQPHRNRTNSLWRIVSGEQGTVALVDYKHERALTAGDNYDGGVYHQDLAPGLSLGERRNQWWTLYAANPQTYSRTTELDGCRLPADALFRFDDGKHRKSLRWKDGNHGDGYLYPQAEWSLQSTGQDCSVWMASGDGKMLLVAGDNYDGKLHVKPNTADWRNRANARWRFERQGNAFTVTDLKHRKQIVAGDSYDGRAYHQDWNGRSNAKWDVVVIERKRPATRVLPTANGNYKSIGAQPMRVSLDSTHNRWWFVGSDHEVLFVDDKNGWQRLDRHALDVHVDMDGMPWVLDPSRKLYRAGREIGNGRWDGYVEMAGNLMRFDVDPLGYPIAVRYGDDDQILHTFPGTEGSVPGAGSCSPKDPFTWMSKYTQSQYGKLADNLRSTVNGLAKGDLEGALMSMSAVAAQSAGGGIFGHASLAGAVMQEIPVKEIQTLGTITAEFHEKAYKGWTRAVIGDVSALGTTLKDMGASMAKGDFKGFGQAFVDNPAIKQYVLGPIVETDWNNDPWMIAVELRARYTLRALELHGELSKYTPAGAAKYAAKDAMKQVLGEHGPGFVKDFLGPKYTPKTDVAVKNVIFLTLQGFDEYYEETKKGGQVASGLYTQARAVPATAVQIWADKGSGGDNDGSFWRPKLSNSDDCISLGDYVQRGYDQPKNLKQICGARAGKGVWWAYPTDFEFIWSDRCSGADSDGSIWMPHCPPGFTGVGFVTNNTANVKPWRDQVACLKGSPGTLKYAALANLQWAWNDRGSGAKFNVETFNRDFGGVPVMYAFPKYQDAKEARNIKYWGAIARVGDKRGAEAVLRGK